MSVFDDLGKKVGDLASNTVQKGKELAEITRLNSVIASEERRLEKQYTTLGQRYYEGSGSITSEEQELAFASIQENLGKIEELKEQVKTLKDVNVCPQCGERHAREDSYCPKCGAKLPSHEPVDEQ